MRIAALSVGAILLAGTASAATTGFTLSINGNNNLPRLTFTNTGDMGDVSDFTITIGSTNYNFDAAYNASQLVGTFGFTLRGDLDTDNGGGLRSDEINYTFTDFNPGEVFEFTTDIDIDDQDTTENYETRFLPGGSIMVNFSGGVVDSLAVDLTPSDGNDSEPYFYGASVTDTAAVPLPAGLPLLLGGLGILGLAARRRNRT